MVSDKIPVQIMWIASADEGGDVEVMMDLENFERSDTSVLASIKELKEKYLVTVDAAKRNDAEATSSGGTRVSASKRWRTCSILTKFVDDPANKYSVTNYTQSLSRDLGLPRRSIKTFLDFGRCFTKDEMFDQIPYSIYREFVFRINLLKAVGSFESEKNRLLEMRNSHNIPSPSEYRKQLTEIVEVGTRLS